MPPGSATQPNAAAAAAAASATAAGGPKLCCCWALLLLASRPTAVEGFAVTPRTGLPGVLQGRRSEAAGDRAGGVSSLFFVGRGGAGAEGDERRGSGGGLLPGQRPTRQKVVGSGTESGLPPPGYPFPHASRTKIRRDAMKFFGGGGSEKPDPPTASEETPSITSQTPDSVIGETLVIQGTVEFKTLLRIDGRFEGEVISDGNLIIGPKAEVVSNLSGLNEVYVEGILIGDCSCNKMQIRAAGCVTGDIMTGSLGMDPSVVLKGSANVDKLRSRSSPPASGKKSGSEPPGASEKADKPKAKTPPPAPQQAPKPLPLPPPPKAEKKESSPKAPAFKVSKPEVSKPKVAASPEASHAKGDPEKEGAAGGHNWTPSSSSINLIGSGVRGGGGGGLLRGRRSTTTAAVGKRALSLLHTGVDVCRDFLRECVIPYVSCFQRYPPTRDYFF
ncbi:unnamed protein product [Pylaiella littoralis]